ncbi:AAA family ATPase [Paraliomyxa miuraensis]|uniref:AAA family ATPase n=1 Tax=Paraliomyxa miuraensis TaxID=376150 RepID=UPI00224FAC4E|nr:AAA family ATPase [Paraliomyxa miuraensis]MCX4243214.1 AAA family ATPase [Paraliomyxa miuraensis]
MDDLRTRIERALRAGVRGVLLQTPEEDRALEVLEHVAERLHWRLHTWSAASGIDHGKPRALADLLHELQGHTDDALWVLLDAGAGLESPPLRRAVRELTQRERGPAVVMVEPPGPSISTLSSIPELVVEALPPPDLEELAQHIAWVADLLAEHDHPDARERLHPHASALARAALGLPRQAVDRLLAETVLEHGPDPDALRRTIAARKPSTLDRSGMLEVCEPVPPQALGGLPRLKAWLHRRALALDPAARQAAIPAPRGVLLLGVQGCGKSLAARVSAHILGLPLLRLEPGRLFGGTVGESEANLRRTLALVERLAPAVLWLDEIDKGLAGTEGAASDAGTAARVVGGLLTWLQERQQPVFVAATANRVDALPPELLRRGRLDEIFFVDLPNAEQRQEILRVHLEHEPRRILGGAPPCADPWPAFASAIADADGWSGAEIEAALVEARLDAFAEGRPLAAADLRRAVEATVPLSRTRAESIGALRAWASERARPA